MKIDETIILNSTDYTVEYKVRTPTKPYAPRWRQGVHYGEGITTAQRAAASTTKARVTLDKAKPLEEQEYDHTTIKDVYDYALWLCRGPSDQSIG